MKHLWILTSTGFVCIDLRSKSRLASRVGRDVSCDERVIWCRCKDAYTHKRGFRSVTVSAMLLW